jgi:RNA polymerase sigma-70 factor (ECF subfamily)
VTIVRRADAPIDAPPGGAPPHRHPPDHVLVAESVAVPERFTPLFDRHAAAVHHYLARRIGPVAEDLLAETFLVAFRERGRYRPERVDVRPWLFGIATNLLRQHLRQEKRRYRALARSAAEPAGQAFPTDEAAERVDARSLRRELAAALAALHRRDRDVLLLAAWADLSYPEIAAVLEIPVGTVRSRLNRARRLVREALSTSSTVEEPS